MSWRRIEYWKYATATNAGSEASNLVTALTAVLHWGSFSHSQQHVLGDATSCPHSCDNCAATGGAGRGPCSVGGANRCARFIGYREDPFLNDVSKGRRDSRS